MTAQVFIEPHVMVAHDREEVGERHEVVQYFDRFGPSVTEVSHDIEIVLLRIES